MDFEFDGEVETRVEMTVTQVKGFRGKGASAAAFKSELVRRALLGVGFVTGDVGNEWAEVILPCKPGSRAKQFEAFMGTVKSEDAVRLLFGVGEVTKFAELLVPDPDDPQEKHPVKVEVCPPVPPSPSCRLVRRGMSAC